MFSHNEQAVIIVCDKDLSAAAAFGQTSGIAFGRIQNVNIDVAANAGKDSSTCSSLNSLEDTILHEFNHANQKLSRYYGAGAEDADNLLLPALLMNSVTYKQ